MPQNYDVIHFEALGEESLHLKEETIAAQEKGLLPADLRYLIVPDSLQEFTEKHPEEQLPPLITIKTHSILPEDYLKHGEKKSIITRSAGYDHLETLADRANITSLRNYCVNAVAQTAVKFLYATTGLLNHYTVNTATFERNKTDSFMELAPNRVVTVFGVGKIGKRIFDLVAANGLTVQAVDARAQELSHLYGGQMRFVTKEEAIRTSDIFINAMNLTRTPTSPYYNENYFSYEYLRQAKPSLIFINVTRGEIAPESALLRLYDEGVLGDLGAGRLSSENNFSLAVQKGQVQPMDARVAAALVLLQKAESRMGNIYVQPHQGFNSDLAVASKAADTICHMVEWYRRGKTGFGEQLPYYRQVI